MLPRIHITGASGSGTTTLGGNLAARLGVGQLDTDSFFWMPTDPPFTTKRPAEARLDLMTDAMARHDGWVVSGSLMGWGDQLASAFQLVVFLYVPAAERIARILRREAERYGPAIAPGGPMREAHLAFVEWARGYDDPGFDGRSMARHRTWLDAMPCPVLEIAGTPTVDESADRVLRALRGGA